MFRLFKILRAIMFALLLWSLVILALALNGCAAHGRAANVPDSLPAVGNGVERTGAHVESAERLNRAAKPLAGSAALPLMNQVSAEHDAATAALDDTRGDLKRSNEQRAKLDAEYVKQGLQLAEVTSGWGYRLQLFVRRAAYVLIAVAVFHYVGGFAALFVPGAWGALLAKAAVAVWPAGWFQSARDNYWFRSKAAQR